MSAPTFYPILFYEDAPAAIEWLKTAFGFEEQLVVPGPDGTIAKQATYVAVDDADAHHDRAKAAGAEIIRELVDTEYGSRDYGARDPEGHAWHFGTYRPAPGEG